MIEPSRHLLFLISFLSGLLCNAQTTITGKVVDSADGQAIPFVHVFLTASQYGTVTNVDGEFELKSIADQDSVVISHITFETQKLKLAPGQHLIKLKSKVAVLNEVVVSDIAGKTVRKAFQEGIKNLSDKKYGRGFYRQVSMTDSIPTEIHEVFYALETNAAGVQRQSIEESRYAKKKRKENDDPANFINVGNFSVLMLASGIISGKDEKEKQILIPLMPQSENFYDFEIEGYLKDKDLELVKIHFKPTADCRKPGVEGTMIVNPQTSNVLHMELVTHNSLGMDKAKLSSGKTIAMTDHVFQFTFDFREVGSSVELNFIHGSVNFIGTKEDGSKIHHTTTASLVLFQQGLKKIKRLEQSDLKKNDMEELKKKKYDAAFWKENPIVKRTPLDEKITSVFDKDGSFGTLFNNPN